MGGCGPYSNRGPEREERLPARESAPQGPRWTLSALLEASNALIDPKGAEQACGQMKEIAELLGKIEKRTATLPCDVPGEGSLRFIPALVRWREAFESEVKLVTERLKASKPKADGEDAG